MVSLLKADFFYRALPWARLLLQRGLFVDDLNVKISQRISVACIYLLLFVLAISIWVPSILATALLWVSALLLLNLDLYRFFANKRACDHLA